MVCLKGLFSKPSDGKMASKERNRLARLDSGQLAHDEKTFSNQAKKHPAITPCMIFVSYCRK